MGNFEKQLQKMGAELDDLESASKASTATVILDQTSVGRLSRMDAMQSSANGFRTRAAEKITTSSN